jgi:DNA-directed RNA polymerase specialized sigma24 family protein
LVVKVPDLGGTRIPRALVAPLRRELISLAFFAGLRHEEIAESVRLPLGTVKSHIRRALQFIRAPLLIKHSNLDVLNDA